MKRKFKRNTYNGPDGIFFDFKADEMFLLKKRRVKNVGPKHQVRTYDFESGSAVYKKAVMVHIKDYAIKV